MSFSISKQAITEQDKTVDAVNPIIPPTIAFPVYVAVGESLGVELPWTVFSKDLGEGKTRGKSTAPPIVRLAQKR